MLVVVLSIMHMICGCLILAWMSIEPKYYKLTYFWVTGVPLELCYEPFLTDEFVQ